RDRDTPCQRAEMIEISVPQALFSVLMIVLTMTGTVIFNNSGNSVLLLVVLGMISATVVLAGLGRFIGERHFPMIILSISICLLLHTSLVSGYLWGWDIQYEFHTATIVENASSWNPAFPSNLNAMLSIVVLGPEISSICSINLIWVMKLLFPLIYSLVPLGLYLLYKGQVGAKIAFYSVAFFMSFSAFYGEMPQLGRQEIAELFLVLLMMVIFSGKLSPYVRALFLVVFSFSLIVSHYALTYLLLIEFVAVWAITHVNRPIGPRTRSRLTSGFVMTFIVISLSWYTYLTGSSTLHTGVSVVTDIANSFSSDFLKPESTQGFAVIAASSVSPLHIASKYLLLLSQFLIAVGVIVCVAGVRWGGIAREFKAFASVSVLVMVAGLIVPLLASSLNTARLFHIGTIFLSPFVFVGLQAIGRYSVLFFPRRKNFKLEEVFKVVSAIMVILLLLFGTGAIYQIAKDNPTSFALNSSVDSPVYSTQEVVGAHWVADFSGHDRVYADGYRYQLLSGLGISFLYIQENATLSKGSTTYFGEFNIMRQEALVLSENKGVTSTEYVSLKALVGASSVIYDNRLCHIALS
ncbi:MAG: DUF2206 domain-containing protein, partial [Candidatus Bathyarchaeota archaeon]|nr:DUF2206 domain-containing protein [Candidatus Bathyarchaeota archaeon]